VYLGQKDIAAISDELGLSQPEFLEKYCQQENDDFIHLKMNGPDCPFLKEGNCIIYKVRPIQCDSWPFWKDNLDQETWDKEVKPFCPGIGQGRLFSTEEIDQIAENHESIFDEPL
jgi:Fe-S-cluster containining protein